MRRNSVILLQGAEELDCTQSEKFLTFFSSSPQACACHGGGCRSSCCRQSLVQAGAAPGLFAALCPGREVLQHLSCPSSSQELRGLLQGSVCLGSSWEKQGNPSEPAQSSSVQGASTAELPLDVNESFVIDASALRFFGFIDSSFQKLKDYGGFRININWVMCQWGLAQPQPIILPGVYTGQERQKTFVQHVLCPGNGQLTWTGAGFELCLRKTAGLNWLWAVISPELLKPSHPTPKI